MPETITVRMRATHREYERDEVYEVLAAKGEWLVSHYYAVRVIGASGQTKTSGGRGNSKSIAGYRRISVTDVDGGGNGSGVG